MNELEVTAIRRALPAWVPDIRYLARTDSTNARALGWAAGGAAHGSLVLADYQTAGRGRLDRRWEADSGSSLLFSVILRPQVAVELRGLLSLAAGVAVCEGLEGFGISAVLKWPNDVLLGERKVSGILAEAAGDAVVLGIGVNVSQVSFPPEIAGTATSLRAYTGRSPGRVELLASLVRHLAARVDGPIGEVADCYRSRCGTLGQRVMVDRGAGAVEDVAVDIDPAGGLILATGTTVRAGDVLELR